ncbi:MAG: ABC transporter ATP-binding protein [Myxococcota bacterium]
MSLVGQNLPKRYGDVVAIDEVSISVQPGEVVALIGPNGAGKSTLLSLLAGLIVPDVGEARIDGEVAHQEGGSPRRHLGFLAGDTAVYGRLRVVEQLRFFGGLFGLDAAQLERRIGEVLAEFSLESLRTRRCDALSSGQLQRVNLARTLLHEPRVLILDEPTTALDVTSQRVVLDAITRAKAQGRAVLFSSHGMAEVEEVADRVILLEAGRVRAEGALAQMRARGGGSLAKLFTRSGDA